MPRTVKRGRREKYLRDHVGRTGLIGWQVGLGGWWGLVSPWQDRLHNLRGPVQNERAGPFVQNLLRI